jgi:hypothetical protein
MATKKGIFSPLVDGFNKRLNDAVSVVMVMSGTRPESPEHPFANVKLMGLFCPAMLEDHPIFPLVTGRPSWFRAYNAQGIVVADGDVGDGIGADLMVSTVDWIIGQPVQIKTPKLFTRLSMASTGLLKR